MERELEISGPAVNDRDYAAQTGMMRRPYLLLKRALDVTVAALGLALLSPLMTVLALLTRIILGSPILFRQQRAGLQGRPFWLVKFRTMTGARDSSGKLLPDAARLRRFGRFLRATSLDELPQLTNVIRGELSLVGPRPLPVEYLPRYSAEQARRHEVKPGITGWAQVKGRNALTWDEKFAYDVWYVDHAGLWLDLKILFVTLYKVVRCEGIAFQGEVSAPEFAPAVSNAQGACLNRE